MILNKDPVATFTMPILDTELITKLTKYWVVVMEEGETDIKIELYLRQ